MFGFYWCSLSFSALSLVSLVEIVCSVFRSVLLSSYGLTFVVVVFFKGLCTS